jgi:hypothetical protein
MISEGAQQHEMELFTHARFPSVPNHFSYNKDHLKLYRRVRA